MRGLWPNHPRQDHGHGARVARLRPRAEGEARPGRSPDDIYHTRQGIVDDDRLARSRLPRQRPDAEEEGADIPPSQVAAQDPCLRRHGAQLGICPFRTRPYGLALSLPRNVREAAAVIYRRAVEERLIRGRSIEGVAAASLYAACRECKVPRTLDEIAEVSRVGKKEIGRSYRFIARELLIHLRPTSPIDYVSRFASELGLTGEVQTKAIELLKEATKKGLTSGRGPTGVAAAAVYIASVLSGERRTQRDVAEVARVTEVTVSNRYKELCEKLGLDVEL